jgi:similar to spore coat protein
VTPLINDYLEVRNAEGMPKLVDNTLALQFLLLAKSGVRNCAIALTEAATPAVREVLINQLETALNLHEEISNLMISKGWFHPYNLNEQFSLDIKSSQTAVEIAKLELFPGDTSRLGMFATPEK